MQFIIDNIRQYRQLAIAVSRRESSLLSSAESGGVFASEVGQRWPSLQPPAGRGSWLPFLPRSLRQWTATLHNASLSIVPSSPCIWLSFVRHLFYRAAKLFVASDPFVVPQRTRPYWLTDWPVFNFKMASSLWPHSVFSGPSVTWRRPLPYIRNTFNFTIQSFEIIASFCFQQFTWQFTLLM